MKKIICYVVALMMLLLVSCDKQSGGMNTNTSSIDVDLTSLSSTMIYSEVYNMMVNPNDYIGKTVRMSGQFALYQDEATGKNYYSVIIADATACCAQGLEYVLEGDYSYPQDYPELGSEITVVGEFQTYEENGYLYCHLIHAELASEDV